MSVAMRQLVHPQNTLARPTAAAKPAGSPRRGPIQQPNAAPIQKLGTTSPPLNPKLAVITVSTSFSIQSQGRISPLSTAGTMMDIPVPEYLWLPQIRVNTMISALPASILIHAFSIIFSASVSVS